MRQRVAYKVFFAGVFKSNERTMDLAVEFLNTLDAAQLITINVTHEGKVVVWYRER